MRDYDDRIDYDELYRDAAGSGGPPWEIGGPQPAFAPVLAGEVRGPRVLDLGCGTGELALALARRGFEVTGVDISQVAVGRARAKAAAEGLGVRFEARDATALSPQDGPFDSMFDSGLLHNLDRFGGAARYLALLPRLAAPGGALFLLAIAPEAEQGWGLSEGYLRAAFDAPLWTDTRVTPVDVAAHWDGRAHTLAGHLLRTVRAAA
ncbi:hypothetical protein Val02_37150 [Virgisporangium aliadipatigenens]|uniref:Methyltransferase domain-containing protein n=1 Tax=Virgisporangium aliadipatigenens TaxID=741659 RepID=A0A8J3YK03_9ACTN|nr:class I SAM-dependent methyltransferase [Virgisporangium aliadipatigenens]GIJ46829.1 hypothetical protein Val02_37150 [Virgisporangium aliadipatigenens]